MSVFAQVRSGNLRNVFPLHHGNVLHFSDFTSWDSPASAAF